MSFTEVESLVLRVRDAQRRCEYEGRQPQPFHEYFALSLMEMNLARQLSERRGATATGPCSMSSPLARGDVLRAAAGSVRA
ncbi:hypothetical protein [Burkholderia orbicola]|uniref:hypothetical protein n=1 Tax=Burkholderia orbicola TaxID=2978683 RepID=UPI002FDF2F5B